jgi:hypothetical protein|tara:strand:- start:464 stop:721 length:258 start_codon:yes stop_codon:yes gene_type:complete
VNIYKVIWFDAAGGGNIGWRPLDDLVKTKPAQVISCGIKLHEDAISITICPHIILDEDNKIEQGDAEIVIPKQWVLECQIIHSHP